jgi:hypothetical protein
MAIQTAITETAFIALKTAALVSDSR